MKEIIKIMNHRDSVAECMIRNSLFLIVATKHNAIMAKAINENISNIMSNA
jgi:hypothetical protein